MRGRLLAGLAVLVFVAIASTGWVTLAAARARLLGVEEERTRTMATQLGSMAGQAMATAARANSSPRDWAKSVLASVQVPDPDGGKTVEMAAIDAMQQTIAGDPGGDARLVAALHGETLTERAGGRMTVHVPIREPGGAIAGALRLRVAASKVLAEAESDSRRLLLALTLIDGGLILLFGALFLRQLIRPLEALARAASRVADGDLEVAPLPPAPGELGTLTASFNHMTGALREQRRSLEASRAQVLAQEKLATVGRLAAGVAHEIGNPLTAVLGYVDLLLVDERSPRAPETVDLLQRIKGETGRIHRIVHELLDYARPSQDAVEPVAWAEVLGAAEKLLRPQPRFRHVALHNELPAGLPRVAGSARRLLQVAVNLLLNAADAMGGSGTVRASARVSAGSGDGHPAAVILSVADSGPGVPEADRERLFDPFFTTKEPGSGTGLGLAVCRSMIESMGGRIALGRLAASQQGAVFEVTLAVWEGEAGEAERSDPARA